jgi:hypothetical protein
MTDKMTESWVRDLYYSEGEEQFWQMAVDRFTKQPEVNRLQLLHAVNAWLDQEDRPTREHASLLTKQRDLEDWHRKLKALGR